MDGMTYINRDDASLRASDRALAPALWGALTFAIVLAVTLCTLIGMDAAGVRPQPADVAATGMPL